MQSQDLEEIKAALWEQAYHQCSKVTWGMAQVMAIRKRAGQLQAKTRSTGRWHNVEAVTIQRPEVCPTGACDIEQTGCHRWLDPAWFSCDPTRER